MKKLHLGLETSFLGMKLKDVNSQFFKIFKSHFLSGRVRFLLVSIFPHNVGGYGNPGNKKFDRFLVLGSTYVLGISHLFTFIELAFYSKLTVDILLRIAFDGVLNPVKVI